MSRFAVLYMFHRADALSLKRLFLLRDMNPDVIIIPCFAVKQALYIPTGLRFEGVRYLGQLAEWANSAALSYSHLYKLSYLVNKRVDSFRFRAYLDALREILNSNQMKLYCDFTPLKLELNLDLSIVNWFIAEGRFLNFEYLVFFEYDIYATKAIERLYEPYMRFDAAFAHFRKATPVWYWYDHPPGSTRSILKWVRQRGLEAVPYACMNAGCMLSRSVLKKLASLRLPYGKSEMRLPTVLTALGFKCTRLDFPMVNYRPLLSKSNIEEFPDAGIFHPVKIDI